MSWLDCEVFCEFETCCSGFWDGNFIILKISGVAISLRSCQKLRPKKSEISTFFWSVKNCHIIIKRLTKFGFYVILPIFKHYRTILTDLSKPYDFEVRHENYIFKATFGKYYICGLNLEISWWKLFSQKVWMILYIFHIYDIVSKWIFTDL